MATARIAVPSSIVNFEPVPSLALAGYPVAHPEGPSTNNSSNNTVNNSSSITTTTSSDVTTTQSRRASSRPAFDVTIRSHFVRQKLVARMHHDRCRLKQLDRDYTCGTLETMSTGDRMIAAKMLLTEARRYQQKLPTVATTAGNQLRFTVTSQTTFQAILHDIDVLVPIREFPRVPTRRSSSRDQDFGHPSVPDCPNRPPSHPGCLVAPAIDGYHLTKHELGRLCLW